MAIVKASKSFLIAISQGADYQINLHTKIIFPTANVLCADGRAWMVLLVTAAISDAHRLYMIADVDALRGEPGVGL